MDEGLKRRLTGAAVLVLLAVIFVPMLVTPPDSPLPADLPSAAPPRPDDGFRSSIDLSEEGDQRDAGPVVSGGVERLAPAAEPEPIAAAPAAPEAPAAAEVVVAPPAPPAADPVPVAPTPVPRPVPAPVLAPAAPNPSPAVATPAPAVPVTRQAWAVQLGTFGKAANARGLARRLRAAGHQAAAVTVEDSDPLMTRVLVYVPGDRDAAVTARDGLAESTGLRGLVVRGR